MRGFADPCLTTRPPRQKDAAGLPAGHIVRELTNLGRSPVGFDLASALDEARRARRVSEAADAAVREHLISLRIKQETLAVIGRRVAAEWIAVREQALNNFELGVES